MYLTILVFLCVSTAALAQKNAIGKPAPEYSSLEWVRPNGVSAQEFDNSVVILEFWATWCVPCIKHMPALVEMEKRYKDQGVKIIAVSWDARPLQIDSFVKTHVVPKYVCIDRGNALFLKKYNERGIPYAIMFGRDGRAVWEGTADSLTPDVVDTYFKTGAVPTDPSEEELTSFSLTVRRALASDKNGVGNDYPIMSYLEINSQPPIGLITNMAEFLGLRHAKRELQGVPPGGLYNLRMKIDTSLRSPAMRDRCLAQLDDILGTRTTIEYRKRTVYSVASVHDAQTAITGVPSKHSNSHPSVRLYSALGQIQQKFGIEMIVDDVDIGQSMIELTSAFSSLEEAIEILKELGISVTKEERDLPTLVIANASGR